MAFSLNLYHDQMLTGGQPAPDLPAAHRLFHVRHGAVDINGQTMDAGSAIYSGSPVCLAAKAEWSQVWRWELALPNAAPTLLQGRGSFSSLRMSRVIATLNMPPGSQWLYRLDQITAAAGRIADRHQHPGPGIRCLLQGTFNVQQDAESVRDRTPGDAWWETGSDTVVAWSSTQMHGKFLRGMLLPVEWEGKVTGTWLSGDTTRPRSNWKLLVDQIISL
ncbi:MAG: hypothetical protein A3G25_20675 [Betaproteobacteria bacterium RIFCSPLOWO2_12_FULL_63_13]|nr:MAG: hypothetical protein A3H32_04060 [Betaproteobacteria bacterium RIFCSPLOWO2_02_FULL_63_19]OGA46654.1 MAG: hypothetical protein A3G25_20675 [Betaproteobacteria bacterium RIFCSPLOWO2_12_FULL_63_13]